MSVISVKRLHMGTQARIGHLNVIKGIDSLDLQIKARIGNLNWITGLPSGRSDFCASDRARRPCLIIGEHAALTNRHLIDCSDSVEIGAFSTVGGWRSQILTHAIDLKENRQKVAPVVIGSYCFVGTGAIILKGAILPNNCVLTAGSVLVKAQYDEFTQYGGNPAVALRRIDSDGKYFHRTLGFVN